MQALRIRGGLPLRGELTIHGAKNSALPILAACLLVPAGCELYNVPGIDDVDCTLEILRQQGCRTAWRDGVLLVDAQQASGREIPEALAQRMRSSVLFLGSRLARFGAAEIAQPGGCELGPRPIDLHLRALCEIGASLDGTRCFLPKSAGGTAHLPYPSVGATENLMLAACGCAGPVVIENAACEPEIRDLAQFLIAAGMEITGAGTARITLRARPLHGACYTVMPDRIETATYLCAVAAAGGEITLHKTAPCTLLPVLAALEKGGCCVQQYAETICLSAPQRLCAAGTIVTAPYPAFPTDAQPPLMAAMAGACGQTRFAETVFSGRFGHVADLRRMGARIVLDGRLALVYGAPLHGAHLTAKDLRGGAALVTAALSAEGVSTVSGLHHLRRGYMELEENLKKLGADILTVEIS